MAFKNAYVKSVYEDLVKKNEGQKEFLQAAQEILESLELIVEKRPEIEREHILERFVEPERLIQFRVAWLDDNNVVRVNRGYRVQYNSAIGPYKGGLRFHPSVNQSILKFLDSLVSNKSSKTLLLVNQSVVVKVVQTLILKVNQTTKLCVSAKAL